MITTRDIKKIVIQGPQARHYWTTPLSMFSTLNNRPANYFTDPMHSFAMANTILLLVTIILVAFVPSLMYLVKARNWERLGKEPYRRLMFMFGWGAVVAVIISIVLEVAIMGNLDSFERLYELGDESFIGAVIVAPVVEEAAKVFGLLFVMAYFQREEDGMVYGIAAGLGFAATENLLYEVSALSVGISAYILTVIIRTISSTLLHATATGVSGLGVGKARMQDRNILFALPYIGIAVLMHAGFNFVAGLSSTHPDLMGDWTPAFSLLIVIGFAGYAWIAVRRRIELS